MKLFARLETAGNKSPDSFTEVDESAPEAEVKFKEMAALQVETLARHSGQPSPVAAIPPPSIVVHKQPNRKSSLGLFTSGVALGTGLIIDDFDQNTGLLSVTRDCERRVTCPGKLSRIIRIRLVCLNLERVKCPNRHP